MSDKDLKEQSVKAYGSASKMIGLSILEAADLVLYPHNDLSLTDCIALINIMISRRIFSTVNSWKGKILRAGEKFPSDQDIPIIDEDVNQELYAVVYNRNADGCYDHITCIVVRLTTAVRNNVKDWWGDQDTDTDAMPNSWVIMFIGNFTECYDKLVVEIAGVYRFTPIDETW